MAQVAGAPCAPRLALAPALIAALGAPALGQPSPLVVPTEAMAIDTASLASGRYATLEALLEKTIFQVDVLHLTLRVDPITAERLAALAASRPLDDAARDSMAAAVLRSRDAWARIRFERDISLRQFVDGTLDNVEKAWRARLISEADFRRMEANLPVWFAFLGERRIRDGDQLLYRIRGESLRTVFVGFDGDVLLDQTDNGPEPPRILLGSYFARGSDFRDRLLRSLLTGAP